MDISHGTDTLLKDLEVLLLGVAISAAPEVQSLLAPASFLRRIAEVCEGEAHDARALTIAHEAACFLSATVTSGQMISEVAVVGAMVRAAIVGGEYDVALRLAGAEKVAASTAASEVGLQKSDDAQVVLSPTLVCGELWNGMFSGMIPGIGRVLGEDGSVAVPSTALHLGTYIVDGKFNVAALKRDVEAAVKALDDVIVSRAGQRTIHATMVLQRTRPMLLRVCDGEALLATQGLVAGSAAAARFLRAVGFLVLGVALRSSALNAAAVGQFPRYHYGEGVVLRVLGKMRDAAAEVVGDGVPDVFVQELRNIWQGVLEDSMAHGLRNMVWCTVAEPVVSADGSSQPVPPSLVNAPHSESPQELLPQQNPQFAIHEFVLNDIPCILTLRTVADGTKEIRVEAGRYADAVGIRETFFLRLNDVT